jgi:endonuclease/exonuclease/phosphatase (EEP) superfamily protein YafD
LVTAAIVRRSSLGGLIALACASALSLLERSDWRFELFTHWRIHYMAGAALLGLLLVILNRPRHAALAGILVVWNGFFTATSFGSRTAGEPAQKPASRLRIASFNVDYGNRAHGRALTWLRQCDADVLVLQELSQEWVSGLRPLKAQYPHWALTLGLRYGDGIAVLSRLPIAEWQVLEPGGGIKQAVAAAIRQGDRRVTVLGVHPMNPMGAVRARQRQLYLTALGRLAASAERPTIVAGDFNVTPWSYLYKEFLRESGLVRQGRIAGTWPAPLGLIGIPIDHVFAGPEFFAAEAYIGPDLGSDHHPLVVDLYLRM